MEKIFEKLIEGGTDLCIKLVISIFILLILISFFLNAL